MYEINKGNTLSSVDIEGLTVIALYNSLVASFVEVAAASS